MAYGPQVEHPHRELELILGDLWEGLQKLALVGSQKQLPINLNSSCLEGRTAGAWLPATGNQASEMTNPFYRLNDVSVSVCA